MSRATQDPQLFNLDDPTGASDFAFTRFPRQLDSDDQANWEEIDLAGFVKPLQYANTNPQTIEIPEVWLDSSDSGTSILPDIERLRALMRPGKNGAPPRLQFVCGDWEAIVVLKSLKTERTRFTSQNVQTRAKLSLTLCEVQGTLPANQATDRKTPNFHSDAFH